MKCLYDLYLQLTKHINDKLASAGWRPPTVGGKMLAWVGGSPSAEPSLCSLAAGLHYTTLALHQAHYTPSQLPS